MSLKRAIFTFPAVSDLFYYIFSYRGPDEHKDGDFWSQMDHLLHCQTWGT